MMYTRAKKHTVRNTSGGFLLVELIVSLFIFSIVMVVAMGSIISALDANRKAQSLESIMNNLNLAEDEMTKSLAVGSGYACDVDCSPSAELGKKITFTSQDDETITYEFVTGSSGTGYITRQIGASGPVLPLTASEIDIDVPNSGFHISGSAPFSAGDPYQPQVSIFIKGKAQAGPRNSTNFSLQTLVSQRVPDINS